MATIKPVSLPINFSFEYLDEYCSRWKITEFAFFGSVLRDDYGPESDVDVLVAFSENAEWSLLDLVRMQQELEDFFGRPVDLVEKGTIRNPFRHKKIIESHQVVYASH
jgi:hypothetical protein